MPRLLKKRTQKHGQVPGSLVYVGEQRVEKDIIDLIDYGPDHLDEKKVSKAEVCFPFRDKQSVTWINIDGLHNVGLLERIGKHFDIHDLVLEDILNTGQRPKFEDHGEYIYIVLKMLYTNSDHQMHAEQISLVLTRNCVLTFQEQAGDIFGPIRNRIHEAKGRIRKMGADYLAYSLIDIIIDHYYVVLEQMGENLERLEEVLLKHPTTEALQSVHHAKRELIFMRKAIWPLRELTGDFRRSESKIIAGPTRKFIDDIYDHALQVLDTVETFRDVTAGLQDIYLSSLSNRMNEVMKTLTIIATIFIPLTFIAGVYGMNFDHMPELHWGWGYFMVWGVMAAVAVVMGFYFKRKKWL